MAPYTGLFFCFLLWIFSPAVGKEFTITCLTSEECVLPCQFQSDGIGARIMWYKQNTVISCTRYGDTSFTKGHISQATEYKGRTRLYADQVLKGNATMVLKDITLQDQGRYVCNAITKPRVESHTIHLVVKAPVREVDAEFGPSSVICKAEGIFPAPTLTWSTDPPSDPQLLQNKTKSQKNQLGCYDIESSLMLVERNTIKQTYICCVSSGTNTKTLFLKHEASIQASPGGDVLIPCSFPRHVLQSFQLTWRFGRSDPIVSINITNQKPQVKVWDQWKSHVSNGVAASSSLKLSGLKSEHQGTFTCEVSTPEQKYVTQTDITLTEDCKNNIYSSVIIGLSVLMCLSVMAVMFLCYRRRRLERDRGGGEEEEEEEMRSLEG
ncbi:Hypothetical predicted protein [Scomber scombrus]|uniref:Ig-like domain-containing protein n=1 Tax=Scomber scombrus TaxID=13677 RepID=A0AAV1PEY2_SCOSC